VHEIKFVVFVKNEKEVVDNTYVELWVLSYYKFCVLLDSDEI